MVDSKTKYLYERLGDHQFQLLVNALLTGRFPGYVPLALRQSDGGRDGVQRSGESYLIYQTKWLGEGSIKDPVSWLDSAVRGESSNIKRLVAEGATKYVLVTNVASTGAPGRGTFDRLEVKLAEHGQAFGVEMTCMWRETVDGMVDSAPDTVKWTYADMLAGWDLIRYLISGQVSASQDHGVRDLLRKVAATQWDEDDKVKFSQVDIDRERVADLFVDVTVDRIHEPTRASGFTSLIGTPGGAAAYLLRSALPFTVVRGAPGQGKSTLSQYVCQAHRAAFVSADPASNGLPTVADPRFPLRFDLARYAAWTHGYDVFDPSLELDSAPKRGKRPVAQSTIECFAAELMSHASGGNALSPTHVQELFKRVPTLLMLDGLDEVGNVADRRFVVSEIDRFCARSVAYTVPPKVIVTTRPSADALPEPSAEQFEVISLNPLTVAQRDEFLRNWCAVHGIHGGEGRSLRRDFKQKSAEPYIGELAGNPMQLTILLDLLNQRGVATPTQRTELYDAYMDLLLAREANKHPGSVKKYRADLMEIVPFLGWYLQSRSEGRGLGGRMGRDDLKAAMKHFQSTYKKPEPIVDDLFAATTDRLWALTSKEQGVFEFEVVSLREYFAAKFLYLNAGEGDRSFDKTLVFRELLRRPYWFNTVRFYAGNAKGSDIYFLAGGIRDELAQGVSRQVHLAAWTLLTDGVFSSRPTEAATVLHALATDEAAQSLLTGLARKEISPLPSGLPDVVTESSWERLTAKIASDPGNQANDIRVRVLRELLPLRSRFGQWWTDQMLAAVGKPTEQGWLALGARCEAAGGLVVDLNGVDLSGEGAQQVLNAGIVPPPNSALERDLLAAVLDGQCADIISIRSTPAQIAVAFSPAAYATTAPNGFNYQTDIEKKRRQDAVAALRRTDTEYARAAGLRRFGSGQAGTTFPWANSTTALRMHVGRCWLASSLAILGAASTHGDGWSIKPGEVAFGDASQPAALIAGARNKADDIKWWRQQLADNPDGLSIAEWSLALWAVGSSAAITALTEEWEAALASLTSRRFRAVLVAAQHIGGQRLLATRQVTLRAKTERGVQMLAARESVPRLRAGQLSSRPTMRALTAETRPSALETIAKAARWFRVDSDARYL
jgi:hypothetical protein